jgi:hypothetical protein
VKYPSAINFIYSGKHLFILGAKSVGLYILQMHFANTIE